MIKVGFIVNAKHRKNKRYLDVRNTLLTRPNIVSFEYITSYPKHATELIGLINEEIQIVIAVGGDGTINEIVNGLMIYNKQAVSFGIIPCGTGNDFARNLKPFSAIDLLNTIENKKTTLIDVGCIQYSNNKSYFLNIADIGFGPEVISIMNRQRSNGLSGKFSYALAILRAFFSYKKKMLSLSSDEFSYNGKMLMVAFCNGSTFAHGLCIHPNCKIDSGTFGVTIIGDVSLMEYIKNLSKLKKGKMIEHKEVHYYSSNSIKISSIENLKIEADGELFPINAIEINVIKQSLKFINSL
jgi:YegS/Rv2252/BmrU family lipid kinase